MTKAGVSELQANLPHLDAAHCHVPDTTALRSAKPSTHASRIALLYGLLRELSFSRLLTEEAARLLLEMGAETRIFNPTSLPLRDDASESHPKVHAL